MPGKPRPHANRPSPHPKRNVHTRALAAVADYFSPAEVVQLMVEEVEEVDTNLILTLTLMVEKVEDGRT